MSERQMKGITVCADCVYYSLKKHKCNRGCTDEGKPTDHFYADCPLPDVEPVRHGHWIEIDDYITDPYYDCSVCGESWVLIDGTPQDNGMLYCPHCGAKMDEVSE